jgi:DNA replication protein DnaC
VKPFDLNIDAMLKRLSLANTRRTWRDLVARAEGEQWSYHDFLSTVVAEEVAHRQQTRIQRNAQRSCFPFLKTVDDFNFTYQSTVKLALLGSALSPDFITDGRNLIFHGKPGRGKTHLAVAIGYRAIQNGFDALFVTAAELIEDLSVASQDNQLANALVRYVAPHVLIVDEVGYLTYGQDAANVLYHVVTQRHQAHRSMVFTSNKHPDDWGAVLHDDDLAAAIIDRVLERGRLMKLDGPSMRTQHLGLDAPAHAAAGSQPVVRISGIQESEFPEPTVVLLCGPPQALCGCRWTCVRCSIIRRDRSPRSIARYDYEPSRSTPGDPTRPQRTIDSTLVRGAAATWVGSSVPLCDLDQALCGRSALRSSSDALWLSVGPGIRCTS